jgi:hypothetical protein
MVATRAAPQKAKIQTPPPPLTKGADFLTWPDQIALQCVLGRWIIYLSEVSFPS